MAMGERRLARRDQEQRHFQIAERDDEAEQGGRHHSRLDDGQRDLQKRLQRRGAEIERRLLDRAVEPG